MIRDWYKLDNAGKVFPSIYNKRNPNSFRISALFFEDVNYQLLDEALASALKRFKIFNVRLRRGFFWHYFEENNLKPVVIQESPFLYQSVDPKYANDFLFSLSYYGKRLTLEVFHALTDATGAAEFLKSICYFYLKLKEVEVINDGTIMTEEIVEESTESKDSFVDNYNKVDPKQKRESKAYMLSGDSCEDNWVEIIHGIMSVKELKEIAKKHNATITQYLGGVLLYSVYLDTKEREVNKNNYPLKLFIPVNARKFFNSKTLRNFFLYIRTTLDVNEEATLDGCIACVKETLDKELTVDYLKSVIRVNVPVEKNFFIRITPLFVKTHMVKFGYRFFGLNTATICFSNLGEVKTPEIMKEYIDRFEFGIAVGVSLPIVTSAISYNDKLVVTFSKNIKQRALVRKFFTILSADLKIVLDTNDLGVL